MPPILQFTDSVVIIVVETKNEQEIARRNIKNLTTDICATAASGAQLGILKYLKGQDPPCIWNEQSCTEAAEDPNNLRDEKGWPKADMRGHLEVLKLLSSQDLYLWNIQTCYLAARGGHLEVSQLLRSQHPPCP
eukprot:gene9837-20458_t